MVKKDSFMSLCSVVFSVLRRPTATDRKISDCR
jgi:hypothetical protein